LLIRFTRTFALFVEFETDSLIHLRIIDFGAAEIKNDCAKLHHYMKRRVSDNPRAQFVCAVATLDTVLEFLVFDSEHTTIPADGPEEMSEILSSQFDLYARMTGVPPRK